MSLGEFRRNDIIGFGEPSDLAGHLFRAKLAEKYGLFGKIPMWGGVKLHQFYPPLASVVINTFSLKLSLLLTIIYAFSIFSFYRGPLTGSLFVLSYFFFSSLVYCGRFPEVLGHLFIIHAFFSGNFVVSGLFLGLAGLTHPLAFMFGCLLLLSKLNPLIYLVAAPICGWWLLPFYKKRKEIGYLVEGERYGTFLSIYWLSWGTIINNLLFVLVPWPYAALIGIGCWATSWQNNEPRFKKLFSRPVFFNQTPKLYPSIRKIKEKQIVILPKSARRIPSPSIWSGKWAIGNYLLNKGINVYNSFPETETPHSKLRIPKGIKIYYI